MFTCDADDDKDGEDPDGDPEVESCWSDIMMDMIL